METSAPEIPAFQIKGNEVVFTATRIDRKVILKHEGKTIHFRNCVFEKGVEIPPNSVINGDKTIFEGPLKFGDAVTVSDVVNLGDGHTFGSWCKLSGAAGQPFNIGNNNSFGFGTTTSSRTLIGDSNRFDSGTEIGNQSTIGNNNIFGRNCRVSTEEIVSIGSGNFFQTGSITGDCEGFNERGNKITEELDGPRYDGETFEKETIFPNGAHFKNCVFLQSCTFGNGTTFEGGDTYFNRSCKFGDRTRFHIHSFGDGHTVGSWGHVQHFSEKQKYGTQIGNDNSFGLGFTVDHGAASFGDDNQFDSGTKIGNFTRFGNGNIFGRFTHAGKELQIGNDNIWRPGSQVESFSAIGVGNYFDTATPPYTIQNPVAGKINNGVRTDTRETFFARARRNFRRIF